MYCKTAESPEGKQILQILDKLAPWEKVELISYIASTCLDKEEYYEAFIMGTEYEPEHDDDDDWCDDDDNAGD